MKKFPYVAAVSALAFGLASPALAASDYFLVIDGVEGEATTAIEVQSWSWGTNNSGSSAQRDGSPRVTASQNTQSLRESPTRGGVTKLTASQNSQSLREPGFGAMAKLDEVTGFTLVLAPSEAAGRLCKGKHIAQAHLLRTDGTVLDVSDLAIGSCDTQGGSVSVRITSGKVRHFSGHVTLLK